MESNTRQLAMQWWDNLTYEEKFFNIIKNKTQIVGYPDRGPNDLTGREIEGLHLVLQSDSSKNQSETVF